MKKIREMDRLVYDFEASFLNYLIHCIIIRLSSVLRLEFVHVMLLGSENWFVSYVLSPERNMLISFAEYCYESV